MNDRPTASLPLRRASRRPTRFRAVVERLDPRQLLTAGFLFGSADQPAGFAGVPLTVLEFDDSSIDLPPATAPVGTPVPLATLTSATGPLSAAGYSGTVDWGDGSAVDAASFTPLAMKSLNFMFSALVPGQTLFVDGPDHTYATPGTYAITVSVLAPGATTPTVFHPSVTIAPVPVTVTGQLNPVDDTGISATDGITDINTPQFFGVTQPGATVDLTASSPTNLGATPLTLGVTVADAAGNWSFTPLPMADGRYFVTATAVGRFGATATQTVGVGANSGLDELAIDTTGPQIAEFRVTNGKTGAFEVGFTDPYGLVLAPLTDPSNYTVGRPTPTPRKGQKFPIASLVSSTVPFGPGAMTTSFYPVTVTGTLAGRQPLIPRNGTYTFAIHASGITSVAGTELNGKFTGHFPTGLASFAGGDFQVKVNVRNGKVVGLAQVKPVKQAAQVVRAKVVAGHHA